MPLGKAEYNKFLFCFQSSFSICCVAHSRIAFRLLICDLKSSVHSQCVYLDRVGGHVAHEVSAVWVIQHGHHSEGVPQQAVQLVDVLSR